MAKKKTARTASTRSQKLRRHVKKVLLTAAKHPKTPFLSAFQILDELDTPIKNKLIQVTGSPGGDKAYVRRAASMDIKDAARVVASEIVQMSTKGVAFTVNGLPIIPSSKGVIALYRLLKKKPSATTNAAASRGKTTLRSNTKGKGN